MLESAIIFEGTFSVRMYRNNKMTLKLDMLWQNYQCSQVYIQFPPLDWFLYERTLVIMFRILYNKHWISTFFLGSTTAVLFRRIVRIRVIMKCFYSIHIYVKSVFLKINKHYVQWVWNFRLVLNLNYVQRTDEHNIINK